jgi:hypothetical protein
MPADVPERKAGVDEHVEQKHHHVHVGHALSARKLLGAEVAAECLESAADESHRRFCKGRGMQVEAGARVV